MFRRKTIIDRHDHRARGPGNVAIAGVREFGRADHITAAMDVENDGIGALGAGRGIDQDAHVGGAFRARYNTLDDRHAVIRDGGLREFRHHGADAGQGFGVETLGRKELKEWQIGGIDEMAG